MPIWYLESEVIQGFKLPGAGGPTNELLATQLVMWAWQHLNIKQPRRFVLRIASVDSRE